MKYGLEEIDIENLVNIFKSFPQIDEVILYGSRAKGNFKPGSDIDLTLKGETLNLQVITDIDLLIDDLYLPWTFDLSIYHNINNPDLIEHINRVGKTLYKRTNK